MNRDRRQRGGVVLPDAAQRLGQDPLLAFELLVEPQRRPVASAAFVRDGTRHRAPERTRLDDPHQIGVRESLLHFEQPHELAQQYTELYGKMAQVAHSLDDALSIANRAVTKEDLVCITGSFYLVGEAKKYFSAKQAAAAAAAAAALAQE